MKKINIFSAIAVSVLVLSCEKNTPAGDGLIEVDLTIDALTDDATKTYIEDNGDGTYTPYWHKNDKLYAMTAANLGSTKTFTNGNEDGEDASFTGTLPLATGDNTIYSYYPSSLAKGRDGSVYKLTIPSDQTITSLSSFDNGCDLLVGEPVVVHVDEATNQTTVSTRFSRKLAVVKVILNDNTTEDQLDGVSVTKVTMTADSYLIGRVWVDVSDNTIKKWESTSNTVSGTYSTGYTVNGTNAIYLIVAPTTLTSGSSLTIDALTDDPGVTISKTVVLPADITFVAGKVFPLTVGIGNSEVEVVLDPVINADNVNLAADATSGSVTFTIDNPAGDGNMTAEVITSSPSGWLTVGSCTASAAPLTLIANDTGSPKTATVRLTYSYNSGASNVTKDVTVTQVATLVALTTTTTWTDTYWTDLNTKYGVSSEVTVSFVDQKLGFVAGGGKLKYGSDSVGTRMQFGGSGSLTKCCFEFLVGGNGTVSIKARSSGSSARTVVVCLDGVVKENTSGNAPKSSESPAIIDVDITATSGQKISIYSGGSAINIYSITWTPE